MVKEENFFAIFGWMITELHLKGAQRDVYAVIYGFTQNDEDWYTGRRKYIADFAGVSEESVKKALGELVAKGFIEKKTVEINGVVFCHYRNAYHRNNQVAGGGKIYRGGRVKFTQRVGENLPTDNIYDNISDNIPPYNTPHETEPEKSGIVEEVKHRINALFNRRESTAWSEKETKQLKTIAKREGVLDELAEIEALYNSGYQYRRRDVITFLNNFDVELDRARNKALPTYGGRPRNVALDKYDI